MKEIIVSPTCSKIANVSEITLSEGKTNRLIFKPIIVNNEKNVPASVKGRFIYQRKGPNDTWEDLGGEKFSKLKKGEGYELTLDTKELLALYDGVERTYKTYAITKIPKNTTRLIQVDNINDTIRALSEQDLSLIFQTGSSLGLDFLRKLLININNLDNKGVLLSSLQQLDIKAFQELSALSGIVVFRQALNEWEENKANNDEQFWHNLFETKRYVLRQLFSSPEVLLTSTGYVGGTNIFGAGSKHPDLIFENELTRNVSIVEIKTPTTSLLGSKYRSVYPASVELAGAIGQVLDYRRQFMEHYSNLRVDSNEVFYDCECPCKVIIGNSTTLDNPSKIRSFESFRNSLSNVQIITYDEVFTRLKHLLDFLSKSEHS